MDVGFDRFASLSPAQQAAFAAQATWVIGGAHANDANDGLTALTALATEGERRRRIGAAFVTTPTTVTLLGGALAGDTFCPPNIGQGGYIGYTGSPGATTLYTGSVTAFSAQSGNVAAKITDSALPVSWTASGLVGKRIRITSGVRAGAVSFIGADLGTKQAIVGDMAVTPTGPFPQFGSTRVTLQVGDPYVIESLPVWPIAFANAIVADINSVGSYAKIGWEGLAFGGTSRAGSWTIVPNYGQGTVQTFFGCDMSAITGTFTSFACLWDAEYAPDAGHQEWLSGAVIMGANVPTFIDPGSDVTITDGTILVGHTLSIFGQLNVTGDGLGVVNASGDGIAVQPGGQLVVGAPFLGGAGKLWGAGNGGVGIRLYSGGLVAYGTSKPTLTGTTGDTAVANALKAYSAQPFQDAVHMCGMVLIA